MIMRFTVRPRARLELAEASDWYDTQEPGLGDEFLDTFERVAESIRGNPFQYQMVYGEFRRALVGKFPYSLIYTVSDSEIVVFSCFHARRDPRRWQRP